jgi:hypothetical protein
LSSQAPKTTKYGKTGKSKIDGRNASKISKHVKAVSDKKTVNGPTPKPQKIKTNKPNKQNDQTDQNGQIDQKYQIYQKYQRNQNPAATKLA